MTHRRCAALAICLALSPVAFGTAPPVLTTGLIRPSSLPTLTSLPLTFSAIATNPMTVNSPPLNGFVPQVVFGLTDQQDKNTEDYAAIPSSSPGGNTLPKGSAPQYLVATYDTGSQSHIINYDATQTFSFATSGRVGGYTSEIAGVSGTETVNISDPLGVYVTGFSNASSTGASLSVTPGTLKGQWSTSILTANQGSTLPNLVGIPMAAQYQTVIKNSQTTHLTVNGTTYKSPAVSLQAQDTPLPNSSYVRLTLDVQSPSGVSPDPVFVPSIDNFNNFVDNPTTPTFWGNLFAKVNGTGSQGSFANEQFLFDTGAEVTVLSEDSAAALGFYSAGPNMSTPDFTLDVAGVGGTQTVPGFFVPQLSVLTNGGPLTWTNVPAIVLDVIDPRDGVGFVPGILGTNLFADRDLVINGGLTNPSVGISPRITPQWTSPAGGNFSSDANWSLGTPDAADLPANFLSSATSDAIVTVDRPYTVGSLTFDNAAHRYTLTGPGPLTLESTFAPPSITVASGSHTINVPLIFTTPATLTIAAGARLDITTTSLTLATSAATVRQYLHDDQLVSSSSDASHRLAYLTTGASTLVELALTGDANLDGMLNADDYALLDRGLATGGAFWAQGDFNYDGTVNSADYLLIDANYLTLHPSSDASLLAERESEFGAGYVAALTAAVPEPALVFVACGLALVVRRYRPASIDINPSIPGRR